LTDGKKGGRERSIPVALRHSGWRKIIAGMALATVIGPGNLKT
jgi:hypothetical protein